MLLCCYPNVLTSNLVRHVTVKQYLPGISQILIEQFDRCFERPFLTGFHFRINLRTNSHKKSKVLDRYDKQNRDCSLQNNLQKLTVKPQITCFRPYPGGNLPSRSLDSVLQQETDNRIHKHLIKRSALLVAAYFCICKLKLS
jgi:hypothetical protein